MQCHYGANKRAPRLTFTDPWKPCAPGIVNVSCLASDTRHESPRHNESVYIEAWHWMWTTLYRKWSVTATTHQEKGIITLESIPSRGTVLPAPHGKGNKCDKNVKYNRTDALSLCHQQYSTMVDIHGPLQIRGESWWESNFRSQLYTCTKLMYL